MSGEGAPTGAGTEERDDRLSTVPSKRTSGAVTGALLVGYALGHWIFPDRRAHDEATALSNCGAILATCERDAFWLAVLNGHDPTVERTTPATSDECRLQLVGCAMVREREKGFAQARAASGEEFDAAAIGEIVKGLVAVVAP